MEPKFSKELIAKYIIYMKKKYDVVLTSEEASEHLDNLAELFLVFREKRDDDV